MPPCLGVVVVQRSAMQHKVFLLPVGLVRVGSYVPTWVGCEGGNLGRIWGVRVTRAFPALFLATHFLARWRGGANSGYLLQYPFPPPPFLEFVWL